ncbi:oxidoreductase domain-containing protein [Streptomyces albus]|uniref:Oxidoreductase domain-containing protein n=1 Tax=Streptomyces albus (strain ATCC 21838 / DSM 41398 / FERM P-419 / JCM 4703 / NBRC 107858) TaxID=1081613 RepID=A0A0B5EH28_STRA4|nr:oxidoreductase domain-containing protein [Streptomyces albus]AOU75773.1 oxidoreductase domain-containing protein [Streptomyces albus]AYN31577.1 gfo/Idh/MocA family oxidoreductase [Streptomyces albus]
MEPLRIGVVGLGVISRFYLDAFPRLPGTELVAVCDLREEALAPHRAAGLPCYDDHRRMLAEARLDAIVVNVPNDAHEGVCRDALEAGVAVCVEKPLTLRLEEGRALTELARARGTVLFTAFHRRYNDNVLALRDGLAEDAAVEQLTVRYLEKIEEHVGQDRWYLDPERCGGGCVADNGPNAFDVARLFLGELTVESAEVVRDEAGVDRQAVVRLRSADGVPATVELDWSYPHGEAKDVTVRLKDGTERRADMLAGHHEFKSSLKHEYVGVLEEFTAAVRDGADVTRPGLAMLELVEAAYREGDAA